MTPCDLAKMPIAAVVIRANQETGAVRSSQSGHARYGRGTRLRPQLKVGRRAVVVVVLATLIAIVGACSSSSSHQTGLPPDRAAWNRWVHDDVFAGRNGLVNPLLPGTALDWNYDTLRHQCGTPVAGGAHRWAALSKDVNLSTDDETLASLDFVCGSARAVAFIAAVPGLSKHQRDAALTEVQRLDHRYRPH
jgi:hypothetical protein